MVSVSFIVILSFIVITCILMSIHFTIYATNHACATTVLAKKIGIVGYWATSISTFRTTDFVVTILKG